MASDIVEVRCPKEGSFAVDREHGIGWWIALVLSFVGIGLPFFVYMLIRPRRLGDRMRCRMCGYRFTIERGNVNFPAGAGAERSSSEKIGRAWSFGTLLAVVVATVVGITWAFALASNLSALLLPTETTTVAGVREPAGLAPTLAVVAKPTEPDAFAPFWVRNYMVTDMWSGPVGEATAISFGPTSAQFCVFLVVRKQDNERLYVLNPYSNDYFWIDSSSVGPAEPPARASVDRADPARNCADADPR